MTLMLLNKAKHFAMNFVSNSTLDDQCYALPDLLTFIKHKLSDLIILAHEVSKLIKNLHFIKTTSLDRISVVVIKNFSRE